MGFTNPASRFREAQQNRTLSHPNLPQPQEPPPPPESHHHQQQQQHSEQLRHAPHHSFVIVADSQLGMTNANAEWETELAYCRQAVALINALQPRPVFCCMCGDIADMERSFYESTTTTNTTTTTSNSNSNSNSSNVATFTTAQCDEIQQRQNRDFQRVFAQLHPSIAMVCLCGNHDVGNRPTPDSIHRYQRDFGDDYLAFWVNGTYHVVLNSCLFSDPSLARDLYHAQLLWLKERLQYAKQHDAAQIFVFSHHPWFLYRPDEQNEELQGVSPYPVEWGRTDGGGFPDSYFHIPMEYRRIILDLFQEYGVNAAFSGHFHQNLVSRTLWGMDMIITAPLSMVFESTGKPQDLDEPNGRGVRVVEVQVPQEGQGTFRHSFRLLEDKHQEQT